MLKLIARKWLSEAAPKFVVSVLSAACQNGSMLWAAVRQGLALGGIQEGEVSL